MQDNPYPLKNGRPWGASLTIATIIIALFGLLAVYFSIDDGAKQPQPQIAQSL